MTLSLNHLSIHILSQLRWRNYFTGYLKPIIDKRIEDNEKYPKFE